MASVQDLQDAVAALGQAVSDVGASVKSEADAISAEIARVEALLASAPSGGVDPAALDAPLQAIKDAVSNLGAVKAAADAAAAAAAAERP